MSLHNTNQMEQHNDSNEREFEAGDVEEEENEIETHFITKPTDTQESTQRAPSEHSYLPGVSHPLCPRELIGLRQRRRAEVTSFIERHGKELKQKSVRSRERTKLPVLEVENVVIFPGSTIPLRFRNKTWKDYLRHEIQMARDLKRIPFENDSNIHHARKSHNEADVDDNDVAKTGQITIGIMTKIEQNSSSSSSSNDSQKGRIGTLVVITALHDNSNNRRDNSRDDQNIRIDDDIQDESNSESEPIVVTAIGTERFEVVSKHELRRHNVVNNGYIDRSNQHQHLKNISFYHVKICTDQDYKQYLLPPPSLRLFPQYSSLFMKSYSSRSFDNLILSSNDQEESTNDCVRKKCKVEYKEKKDIIFDQHKATTDQQHDYHYQNRVHNMSRITSLPSFVWKMACPQHLQEQISCLIYNEDIFKGLRSSSKIPPPLSYSSIPHDYDKGKSNSQQTEINPLTISYWLSSNLPISESQRIELLSTHCLTKRLRRILCFMKDMVGIENTDNVSRKYRKIMPNSDETNDSKKSNDNKHFYCQICSADICHVKETFTVNGAEGISGAYVNEHGIIHQTITVRNVIPGNVVLIGRSETKDSWFPGYSWTILYCKCGNHIGWKYNLVEENQDSAPQLKHFWGLSHASVSTVKVNRHISHYTFEDMFFNLLVRR